MRAKNAKGAANAWASEEGRAAAEDERGASLVIRRCTKRIGRQAREVTRTRNKAFCASAKKPTGQGGGRDTLAFPGYGGLFRRLLSVLGVGLME